jgi:small-conductance mechanosensitive channel
VATMAGLAANIWRFFVAVIAVAIILGMLGINLTPLLASATIIGATLGFGAQQIVRDYISGFLLTVEDQYSVGDSITVDGVDGVVEEITLRLTRLRSADGGIYFVPNGDVRLVTNASRGWAHAVVDLTLSGAVAADLDHVREVIGAAAHRVAQLPAFVDHCTEPPHPVQLLEADATTLTLRVMLNTVPSQRDSLTRALREAALADLSAAALWPGDPAQPAGLTDH